MPIYEIKKDSISEVPKTTFEEVGLKERRDLQRLLRDQIEVISPDLLVIAEEFSEWEESKRSIDLLAIDRDANLVVIELKRTREGGHMELQAVRYAAMVSAMTYERAEDVFNAYLEKRGGDDVARELMLSFLGWDSPNDGPFGQDVSILLVAADFSKELTTSVLWLNEHGLDIRCVRIRPYLDGTRVLMDVQQVIPLKETAEYQVQIREKGRTDRTQRSERNILREKFWTLFLNAAREKTDLHAKISPGQYSWISGSTGIRGIGLNYAVRQNESQIELYIDRGKNQESINLQIFCELASKKKEIEDAFGGALKWEPLESKRACRISYIISTGGYRTNGSVWADIHADMIDAMIRLEKALRPHLDTLEIR